MKRIPALVACFLFISLIAQAQDKEPKFLIELSVGPSFPIGKFAAKSEKDNDVAGFAKTGLSAQLSLGYYLNRSVGLMLLSGYSVHPRDEQAYKNFWQGAITNLTVNHVDAESWKAVKIMAGGFVVTPITAGSELVLRTKLLAGINKTAIPKLTWDGVIQNGSSGTEARGYPYDDASLPWSFCYQISMTLDYKLNRKLHLLLDVNSFNSTVKKTFTFPIVSVGPNPPAGTITSYMEVHNKYKQGMVNVLAGIGLDF